MTLAAGSRVGHFEIISPIGAGGMGEVYRAHDPRLHRDVAIKVLPHSLSSDRARLERFEQEARAVAALNHPNILAVFDVGTHQDAPYIVSELLEGATLRARVKAGSVRKPIETAIAIASGLAAAHARHIVHRDLKPDNIFVTTDGHVKILDFGLAKLQVEATEAANETTTLGNTPAGVVLGTPGYMAPEQVRGQPVDHRSDIFSFGAILYEMLSGVRAFAGPTTADTVAAVLNHEPKLLARGDRAIAPGVARIVDRCLEKNPASRFQSASDLVFALEEITWQTGATQAVPTPQVKRRIPALLWVLAGLLLSLATLGAIAIPSLFRHASSEPAVLKLTLLPPPGTRITDRSLAMGGVPARRLSLSPDGLRLAFTAAGSDGVISLWVQRLDSLSAQKIEGTDGAVYPFWSPDSKFLAFFVEDGRQRSKLMTIDVSGGSPSTVCELPTTNSTGGTWSQDGVILFGVFGPPGTAGELQRVNASGGVPAPATRIDPSTGETRHYQPYFLEDGRHFLYLAVGVKGGDPNTPNGLYVGLLDSLERKLLMSVGSTAKYANGQLLFIRESTLLAQPFDPSTLALSGDAVPLADQLFVSGPTGAAGAFTVSNNGVLAFQSGAMAPTQLSWFNRKGEPVGILDDRVFVGDIALSADAARLSVNAQAVRGSDTDTDVWIYDVARVQRRPFVSEPALELAAVWSPDGHRLAYASNRKGVLDLYVKPADGSGEAIELFSSAATKWPTSWSSDDHFILFRSDAQETKSDLWVLPLFADRTPFPYLKTGASESQGQFSPDGRWVAYVSDETRRFEVYVAPFPGPGKAVEVSTGGGNAPKWAAKTGELFYVGPGDMLTAAELSPERDSIHVVKTTPLFRIRPRRWNRYYDVTADGQRFLVNTFVETGEQPVTVIVNWTTGLKKPRQELTPARR